MAEGKNGGDGKVSPFGNHAGDVEGGGGGGKPQDFLTKASTTSSSKVVDPMIGGGLPQPKGPPDYNPDTVPAGGRQLKADPSAKPGMSIGATPNSTPKPFKGLR
jgi:hypothetical protein